MDKFITAKKSSKIKYIAVILMIILHLFSNPIRDYISIININGKNIEYIITKFCSICVGVFVFLSGYGLTKKYSDNINYKMIGRKILRFYINYWYIFLLFIPIGLIMGKIQADPIRLTLNFFAVISNYNYEWWFVILYVQLLLMFPIFNSILNKCTSKKKHIIIYIVSLIISIIAKIIYKKYIGNIFVNIFFPLLIYQFVFITGMLIAKDGIYSKISERVGVKNKKIEWLLFILIMIFMNITGYIPVVGKIVNPIMIPIYIYILADIIKEPKSVTIYKTSTNIWLIHTFFTKYYFPEIIWNLKYSILIVIWTIILVTSISVILDKILDKIYKMINI